jgi:sulfonate transport system permease protein
LLAFLFPEVSLPVLTRQSYSVEAGRNPLTALKGSFLPILIIAWWLVASALKMVNGYLVPSPASIMHTTVALLQKGILIKHVTTSLYRIVAGFGLTFLLAFPLAVVLGTNRWLTPYFDPLLHFVRHIPPISCIPIFILWLGIGEASKLAIIVLAAFFPVFLNTLAGIVHCDPKLLEVGQIFGLSCQEKFHRIILPAALPSIILGIRLGLGYSWRALIGAELIAASAGVGYMIIEAEQLSRPDIVIVGILVIGSIGYLIDHVFLRFSLFILPWNGEKEGNDSFTSKGAL